VAQNVLGPLAQEVPNFAATPEELIASGDTVAAVTRYTGTGKATGKELDLRVVHVWDVRDGKITQFRQFADTAKFLEAVPAEIATTSRGLADLERQQATRTLRRPLREKPRSPPQGSRFQLKAARSAGEAGFSTWGSRTRLL
jgi:hypothetical protein